MLDNQSKLSIKNTLIGLKNTGTNSNEYEAVYTVIYNADLRSGEDNLQSILIDQKQTRFYKSFENAQKDVFLHEQSSPYSAIVICQIDKQILAAGKVKTTVFLEQPVEFIELNPATVFHSVNMNKRFYYGCTNDEDWEFYNKLMKNLRGLREKLPARDSDENVSKTRTQLHNLRVAINDYFINKKEKRSEEALQQFKDECLNALQKVKDFLQSTQYKNDVELAQLLKIFKDISPNRQTYPIRQP